MKVKYNDFVLILYLLGFILFIVGLQETSCQEIASIMTIFALPFLGKIIKSKACFKTISFLIVLYIIFEMIISFYKYHQDFKTVILYYAGEFIVLLLYVFLASYNNKTNYKIIIIAVGKIDLLFLWVSVLLFNFWGINILDDAAIAIRHGSATLYYGTTLFIVALILSWSDVICKMNIKQRCSKTDVFFLLSGVVYLMYGCRSRALIVLVVTSLFVIYLFGYNKPSKKIISVFVVFILLILFSFLPGVQDFLERSFGGIINGTDASLVPRIQSITHYLDVFMDNKMFGIGIASATASSNNAYDLGYLLRGPWGVFYTNDVGILGVLVQYGIIGTALYLAIIIKMVKIGLKERQINPYKLGIAVFVLLGCISITYFDTERQAYLALILLCFDLKNCEVKT